MLSSGWDCFTPDAGKWESKDCPTCGAQMTVRRDCKGPRGFAANMARHMSDAANMEPAREYAPYDFFQCPHAKISAHQQARDLKKLAKATPSPTLRNIYVEDAKSILRAADFSYNGEGSKE